MKTADVIIWIMFAGVPSIVFYAVLVAAVAFVIRKARPGRPALRWALATVAAAAVLITVPGNAVTAWRSATLDDADVQPARPIPLRGEVLIDRVVAFTPPADRVTSKSSGKAAVEGDGEDDWRLTAGCGNICRALLATPGITAVTVNPTGDRVNHAAVAGAVRYRISDPSGCGPDPDIGVESLIHESLFHPPRVKCVAPGRPVKHVDFVIREANVEARDDVDTRRAFQTQMLARPVGYYRTEIVGGGGKKLFRATRPFLGAPMLPLIAGDWLFGEQRFVLGAPLPFLLPWLAGSGTQMIGVDRMLIERTTIRRP